MSVIAIDAHCHADILIRDDSSFPVSYRELRLAGISWSYAQEIESWKSYPDYWENLRQLSQNFTEEGIPFFYLVGIHPRCIPPDLEKCTALPGELSDAIALHLQGPLCLGLGELGLDSANIPEEKILRWQLDWAAKELPPEKRIGIHTPRKNKEQITLHTLSFLEDYAGLRSRILLDHVNAQTLPVVLQAGYMAGITLQEGKTSVSELFDLLEKNPEAFLRILLNSDGAKCLSTPYFEFLKKSEHLKKNIRRAILTENASRFFGILQDFQDVTSWNG